jgi:DNA-binding IclR family transcriptional regulator
MPRTAAKPIQSVERALTLLEQFSVSNKELSLAELSRKTGLKRTTCFGLAETLEQRGYLQYNTGTNTYSVGVAAYRMGQVYAQSMDLRNIASPYIKFLAQKYGTVVHLAVPDGHDAVYIDKTGEKDNFRIRSHLGKKAERFSTALSKILLSRLGEGEFKNLLAEPILRYTVNTVTDPDAYAAVLARVREEKVAFDMEELEIGLVCVAVPLVNEKGALLGIISISGPAEEMKIEMEAIKADLLGISREIQEQIGDTL